jgi:hypothetical protein
LAGFGVNNLILRTTFIAVVLPLSFVSAKSQNDGTISKTSQWGFRNYPAEADFRGMPARPKLTTSKERTYKTRIRTQERRGPNFAGHFTLAKWGCGSPCLDFVIIDARTGAIYDSNFIVGCADNNSLEAKIEFKLTSRLLVMTGFKDSAGCGTDYYEWNGKQLTLVHFQPWSKAEKESP